MIQNQGIKFAKFTPGVVWFIVSVVLLTLPGSAFPQESWLDDIHFDKWVHIGMFSLLVFLFSLPFIKSYLRLAKKKSTVLRIAVIAVLYGIAMEFVQKYWIPNRSFDLFDIIADGVGSFLPFLLLRPINNFLSRKNVDSES